MDGRKSQALTLKHIRSVFRLVGEVCEHGDHPSQWRPHLLAGLFTLVNASVGFAGEENISAVPGQSATLAYAVMGLDEAGVKGFEAYNAEGGFHIHPIYPSVLLNATRRWTRLRRQIVPSDRAWYGDRVVSEYQKADDIDEMLHSRRRIPRARWADMITLFRHWGDRPFSERDRQMVQLCHDELALRWQRPPAPDPADELPPRQRQIVAGFRRGLSEKQIALQLGLSPQTVHQYVKNLYRRVDVGNRFDLLEKLKSESAGASLRLGYQVEAAARDPA